MGKIVLLDELTINQIAAGEVIERPANVVKELVENSIDAGAKNITVEIKNGGISYIRITDDGKGIEADDILIAFERHATSKIRSSDDLTKVMTMGFRGEALASVASIANVTLTSCPENMTTGNIIKISAGNVEEFEEYGCPKGTTIIVENIFFNTPVRYKFLKKDFTEAGYIEDVITKLALINPHISFKYINAGKTIINTSGNADIKTIVHNIYGGDFSNSVLPLEYDYENIHIYGLIGKPEIARSNRSYQLTYINSRYVKNKTITSAIDEAYRTLIPNNKFGFVILNIQMNPKLVDVNVHPAKLEVRFQNESDIFKAIYHSIKNTLLSNDLTREEHNSSQRENEFDNRVNTNSINSNLDKSRNFVDEDKFKYELNGYIEVSNNMNYIESYYENSYTKQKEDNKEIIEEAVTLFDMNEKKEERVIPKYKYIGTVFDTYIILEYNNDMYVMDQHAAHERVIYEKIKESYYSEKKLSQMMLLPELVKVTNKEYSLIIENMEMFEKAGYVIEEFGDNTFKITGVPYICMDINIKELFLDIVDEIDGTIRTTSVEKEERFIFTVACKAAVKANNLLKDEEVKRLIEQVLVLNNPFTCPHGRPTAIKMSKYEIERKFGRK